MQRGNAVGVAPVREVVVAGAGRVEGIAAVARVAVIQKLVTIFDAMLCHQQPWAEASA